MKRNYSISFIAFAILLMQLVTAIPHHHHHDGTVCFKMEQMEHDCDQKQTADDHDTPDHAPEQGHCIVHAEYVFQQTDSAVRFKPVSSFPGDKNSFSIDLYVANLVDIVILEPDKKPDYGKYTCSFLITDSRTPFGLRAPPSFLS